MTTKAKTKPNIHIMDRRHFIIGAGLASGQLAALLADIPSFKIDAARARAKDYKAALQEVLKGATPSQELLSLKMPEIAENGNVVSVTLDARAAQEQGKNIDALYIFATDNPWPYVATFKLSKLSGQASVTSRMRLARSQKVIALAAVDDGSFLMAETFVKVTIGGCGG